MGKFFVFTFVLWPVISRLGSDLLFCHFTPDVSFFQKSNKISFSLFTGVFWTLYQGEKINYAISHLFSFAREMNGECQNNGFIT